MAPGQVVFDDEIVSATSLNRQPGRILDLALEKPVTIMRNEQAFALLRRELASSLFATSRRALTMVDFIQAVYLHMAGRRLADDQPYEWVTAFDHEDLQQMAGEVLAVFRRGRRGEGTWDEFDAVLHEWEESAWAARSSILEESFRAVDEEVPLTVPPASASGRE